MEYKIHDVEWTDEKVARFWNFHNKYEAFENNWFTKQVGKGVINFTRKHIKIKGNILDYGTGKGHLIKDLLLNSNTEIYGFDFSAESINTVNNKYKGEKNYKGTSLIGNSDKNYTGYADSFFDVVFLIEAIEHLTDKYLETTIEEINRILKKGGLIVVTTPNDEDLPLQNVVCPDCGGVFHRVQHMRSFNTTSLETLLNKNNFGTVYCGTTEFSAYNNPNNAKSIVKRLLSNFREKQPHLVFIGKKNG